MLERDPEIAAKTSVIWESPEYGINPVVVRPTLRGSVRAQLENALLTMTDDADGRRVLRQLGIDRFAQPTPNAYDSIERMIRLTSGDRLLNDAAD